MAARWANRTPGLRFRAPLPGARGTGLEDNPVGDEPGWSNVAAVGLAVAAAELAHRRVATPDEARIRFGLRVGTAG